MDTSMRTYRCIMETDHGLLAVDVVLRGKVEAVDAGEPKVKSWLDFGIGYAGAWVDQGTERTEQMLTGGRKV